MRCSYNSDLKYTHLNKPIGAIGMPSYIQLHARPQGCDSSWGESAPPSFHKWDLQQVICSSLLACINAAVAHGGGDLQHIMPANITSVSDQQSTTKHSHHCCTGRAHSNPYGQPACCSTQLRFGPDWSVGLGMASQIAAHASTEFGHDCYESMSAR